MKRFIMVLSTVLFICDVGIISCKKNPTNPNNSGGGNNGGGNNQTVELRLTTHFPSHITGKTAIICCEIDLSNWSSLQVDEFGVCWDTINEPQANDEHVSTDNYYKPFVYCMNELSLNTQYYVRAYAIDNGELYYGEEQSFITDSIFSTELNYYDKDTISLVLRESHPVLVSSDYGMAYNIYQDETYQYTVLSITDDGVLEGLNVGRGYLYMTNGYEEKMVDVIVNLFEEPTFAFGCKPSKIRSLYGNPYQSTIYNNYTNGTNGILYRYTSGDGYSWACGEMVFVFDNNDNYIESLVYLRRSVDLVLNNYFNENFIAIDTTLVINEAGDMVDCFVYQNINNPNVRCSKFLSGNMWDEILLIYNGFWECKNQNSYKSYLIPR